MTTSNLVARYGRNPVPGGRDLIVGDIHGHFARLERHLAAVGFDPIAGDRLFSVGDLVDRGPESMAALDWLAQPWFHAVAGNHEDYAIRWPNGHMDPGQYAAHGGAWNIANDAGTRVLVSDTFSSLPIAIELETYAGLVGIVHAECPCPSWTQFVAELEGPATTRRARLVDMAQWSRNRADNLLEDVVTGVRAVVVGHDPKREWTTLGNTIFIDTMGWKGYDFTILDAATLRPAINPNALARQTP